MIYIGYLCQPRKPPTFDKDDNELTDILLPEIVCLRLKHWTSSKIQQLEKKKNTMKNEINFYSHLEKVFGPSCVQINFISLIYYKGFVGFKIYAKLENIVVKPIR